KRAEEAIPILEAITLNRIAPDAEVWAMLGRAHLASGTPALALSALNEALQIDPRQAENRALRGSLLRQIGDLDGALADYQTAARLSPADASIAYAKGLVHLQLGQIPEAEQALARAAATLPEPAGLQLLHALLAHTLGQTEAAEASLLKYQTAIPEKRNQAARYLAYLLGQTEPGPEASDEVSQYIRGDLTRKQALDTAGRAQTPELARRQICATAFWMAQHAHRQGEPDAYQALLKIAVNLGHPDLTEFQLAKWQLEQTRPQSTKQK
ncbi:MAG: tetratricopeptide repeat protein, partial [Puniceicoccaceae bacterium]